MTPGAGKGVEPLELSHNAGGNVQVSQPLWKTVGQVFKCEARTFCITLTVPPISLPMRNERICPHTLAHKFSIDLSLVVRNWKQPKCPITAE